MNVIFCMAISVLAAVGLVLVNRKYELVHNAIWLLPAGLILFLPAFCLMHFHDVRKLSVIGYGMIYFVLAVLALSDIREKLIHKYAIYLFVFICALIMLLNPYTNILNNIVTGSFMTIVCFVIYKLGNDKVGSGDVWIISALSFALGYPLTFSLLFAAMFIAMIYGIVLIITKKATVRTEIPFIPFLFIGYIVNVLNF